MKISFILLLFPLLYLSQITPGRPGEGTGSDIVDKGSVVLENTLTYEPNNQAFSSDHLIRFGLSKRWEFLVETHQDFQNQQDSSYGISTKYNLVEEKTQVPALTLIGITSFNLKEYSFLLASTKNFGDHFSAFSTTGYQLKEMENFLYFSLGMQISLREKWFLFTEYHGNYNSSNLPDHNLELGANYLLSDRIQLNFSTGSTLKEMSSNYFLSTGFSFQIN
ncbi:hypothetical protein [Chryseobacterium sp. MP_3.2]|uniref:hypothetical protein n=1 Tax=Chryseobacterium sp. MP_3.2 TaxID=3071712 RepID=UPI002E144B56